MRERDGADFEIDMPGASANRIQPFEFLYLLCNAEPRLEKIKSMHSVKVGPLKLVVEPADSPVYPILKQINKERRHDLDLSEFHTRHNPREKLYQELAQSKNVKIRIADMGNALKELHDRKQPALEREAEA